MNWKRTLRGVEKEEEMCLWLLIISIVVAKCHFIFQCGGARMNEWFGQHVPRRVIVFHWLYCSRRCSYHVLRMSMVWQKELTQSVNYLLGKYLTNCYRTSAGGTFDSEVEYDKKLIGQEVNNIFIILIFQIFRNRRLSRQWHQRQF